MQKVDGANFGPSFAHNLQVCYPTLVEETEHFEKYEPRIFGFKINSKSIVRPN